MRILVITFNVNKNTTSYRVIKENKLKAKWSKNVKKIYRLHVNLITFNHKVTSKNNNSVQGLSSYLV